MKKILYVGIGIVTLLAAYVFFPGYRNTCRFVIDEEPLTIATVECGPFREYIPQTGTIEMDSSSAETYSVNVPVDQLYLDRISKGLEATTTMDNVDYALEISNVCPTVVDGRFQVRMNFTDDIPCGIPAGRSLRLRIALSPSSDELLLPVGGFYKDTGGKWAFVIGQGDLVTRRHIKLGRKMGSEYFEVLEGLEPGDRVVTSSYENFMEYESLDLLEMEEIQRG